MKIEWNKVTWYSKALALLLVIALPIMGFKCGFRYGEYIGFQNATLHSISTLPVTSLDRGSQPSDKPTGRIVLTPDYLQTNIYNKENRCDEQFNFDDPDSSVLFNNSEKGIRFQVPYNAKWGNETYSVQPYDEQQFDNQSQIAFGPIGIFEGCGWVRSWFLRFTPVQSTDEVIEAVKNNVDCFNCKPEAMTINNLEVVKYTVGGLCDYPTMVIIGKKYNYEFTPLCGGESSFEKMESIIKTVSLFD